MVSIFVVVFSFFSLFFFTQGKISWDILNAILCHRYHPNHSNRVIYSEWRQHNLEMGEYTIDLFADISTWETCTETRFRSNIWKEYTHNKGQTSLFVQIVGFTRFVWPCLDDSDDIRDLQWRINLEKIVDCCPMRVMEWSNRLRYSCFCIPSSASVCFW